MKMPSINASNEAFLRTKKQLRTSNMLEKVINWFIPQVVEEKKELVAKFLAKKNSLPISYLHHA